MFARLINNQWCEITIVTHDDNHDYPKVINEVSTFFIDNNGAVAVYFNHYTVPTPQSPQYDPDKFSVRMKVIYCFIERQMSSLSLSFSKNKISS
jgi:hypothetical protein